MTLAGLFLGVVAGLMYLPGIVVIIKESRRTP